MVEIHNVEQKTLEWFQLKLGKIGGSTFKNFINLDGKLKSNSVLIGHIAGIIAEIETGMASDQSDFESDAMAHGNEYEPICLEKYFTNSHLRKVGWATNPKYKHAGISPDAVYFDLGKYNTGLEIKCPTSKVQIKRFIEDKIPNEYLPQILMYFLIFEDIQVMTFASFDPFNEKRELFKKIVSRSQLALQLENANKSLLAIDKLIDKHLIK